MNKQELIEKVASKAEVTKAEAAKLVNTTLESITEGLAADGKVVLIGFGTFEVRTRTARTARNPRTGEAIKVAASRVPAFKAGKAMKEAIPQKAPKGKKK